MSILFNEEVIKVAAMYPKLSIEERAGILILSGDLELINEQGDTEDTYAIEIHPSPLFPYRFPYLYETGGRIPINIDWHRFEPSGRCCVRVPPDEILICKGGISLINYIRTQAVPYFFNQTFRRKNGYFLNESRHGLLGVVDFYFEKLETTDIYKLLFMLNYIITEREPSRVERCFCGSGLKYRKCHRDSYRLLKQIGNDQINADITEIKKVLTLIKK